MVRLGMIVAALALAGGADAAPFAVAVDGLGSAWVLDEASGATRLCRAVPAAGPKVLDVFGGAADVRPGPERTARADCAVALRAIEEPVAVARGMLGDGSSGPQVGSAAGMLGSGRHGWSGGPETQIIIVRPGAVAVGLY